MLRLQGWRPINWPGDDRRAVGPRPRVDWLTLAVMLIDLALFAIYVAPWFQARSTSGVGFVVFLVILGMIWLGPFLGLLLRRGRGAALLSYAIPKLFISLAIVAWWWGNRRVDANVELGAVAKPVGWHLAGALLCLLALVRGRRIRSQAEPVIASTSPTAAGPG